MKRVVPVFIFFLTAGLSIWSCNKHVDLPEPADDLTMEKELVGILGDMNYIQSVIDNSYLNNPALGCGSVGTASTDSLGRNFYIIDFTSSGCTDSIKRAGKLKVYYNGIYGRKTYRDSIRFIGFLINGNSVSGYRTRIVNDSAAKIFSISDSITFKITKADTLNFPEGKTYQFKSNTTRTDNSTYLYTTIYGGMSGTILSGESFTVSISAASSSAPTHLVSFPLKYNWFCNDSIKYKDPVSGALTFTNTSRNISRTINFEERLFPDIWSSNSCTWDTATYISPKGNVYYFGIK
jgi:hypothetical protein